MPWSLRQFESFSGRKELDEWRGRMAVQAQADMDRFLQIMVRRESWNDGGDCKRLTGKKYQGLVELRWKSMQTQHRIIGCYCGQKCFVALIGCTHKQARYDPTNCLDSAVDRRKKIEHGEARTDVYAV